MSHPSAKVRDGRAGWWGRAPMVRRGFGSRSQFHHPARPLELPASSAKSTLAEGTMHHPIQAIGFSCSSSGHQVMSERGWNSLSRVFRHLNVIIDIGSGVRINPGSMSYLRGALGAARRLVHTGHDRAAGMGPRDTRHYHPARGRRCPSRYSGSPSSTATSTSCHQTCPASGPPRSSVGRGRQQATQSSQGTWITSARAGRTALRPCCER